MKKYLAIATIALALSQASIASATANREICIPQNADMSQTSFFATVCDWSLLQPGADTNPIITLNGGQSVYAECEFTGSDSIALVEGKKHAAMKVMVTPGNQFSFGIDYDNKASSNDDNQNIIFYLNTRHPSYDDQLVCRFYSLYADKKHAK